MKKRKEAPSFDLDLEIVERWRTCTDFVQLAKRDPNNVLQRWNGHPKVGMEITHLEIVNDRLVLAYCDDDQIYFAVDSLTHSVLWAPSIRSKRDHGIFFEINWSSVDALMLPNVALAHIFTFLSDQDLIMCTKVCRAFRNVATSAFLWKDRANAMEQNCRDMVIRKPDLSYFHQYLYYSFTGNAHQDTLWRFMANHPTMRRRIFVYWGLSLNDNIYWQRFFKNEKEKAPTFWRETGKGLKKTLIKGGYFSFDEQGRRILEAWISNQGTWYMANDNYNSGAMKVDLQSDDLRIIFWKEY